MLLHSPTAQKSLYLFRMKCPPGTKNEAKVNTGPKGRRKQENIAAETTLRPGRKNVFGNFQKHSLLSRRRFCVFNICCVGAQTRKHLGNTETTLIFNVSPLFPRLLTHAKYFKDIEFASRKQKMFCLLPVCSPMQHCEQHRL